MKRFKTYLVLILILQLSIITSFGQKITKKKQLKFDVNKNDIIELNSTYTNIEIELTNSNSVTIDATMNINGLSEKDANNYFNNWNLKTSKNQNKLVINSIFKNKNANNLNKNGYYNGYFIETKQLEEINAEINNFSQKNIKISNTDIKNKSFFNYDLYIKEGNKYLEKWQKDNNEPIGKRWFNKTKKERIALQKATKKRKPNKIKLDTKKQQNTLKPKEIIKVKLKRNNQPKSNVRALSNRAIINKTLKIKIPKQALLSINARHGKVTISNKIKNLKANLNYVLLNAKNITGLKTYIKSAYTNFEIEKWEEGKLETAFSNFVLLKEVKNIDIVSNTSIVSIDKVTNKINVNGSFKMLSIDFTSTITNAKINVEDSKQVWIKLPKTKYNLSYTGLDTKLIHPEKFKLLSYQNKPTKQYIKSTSLSNNEKSIEIYALSSIMQVYDINWENLKIKNLDKL